MDVFLFIWKGRNVENSHGFSHMIDIALFNDVPVAKTGCILFYIGMEGLSILENLGQMNVPLPKFIHENLEVLKQKGEHTDS